VSAQHRCDRGPRCYVAEKVDDQMAGAVCDRPLCDPCTAAVATALDETVALYVALRLKTLQPDTTGHTEQVTVSKGSPMPVNAAALHLTEQVHWLLTTWEDEVRSIASLTYPTRLGKREGRQVQDAAHLLATHLSAWIAAPLTEFATSRWTATVDQTGAEAAGQLLDWRNAARNLPGVSPAGTAVSARSSTVPATT
jgi:hypothetical protein